MDSEHLDLSKSSSVNGSLTDYALQFVERANNAQQQALQKIKAYGFVAQGKRFLLPIGTKAELISNPKSTPLPNSPSHCLGLVNVRGSIAPFYTLESFFHDGAVSKGAQRYGLLLGNMPEPVMILVDDKPIAVDLDSYTQAQTIMFDFTLREFVSSVYEKEASQWLMLDIERLFYFLAHTDG